MCVSLAASRRAARQAAAQRGQSRSARRETRRPGPLRRAPNAHLDNARVMHCSAAYSTLSPSASALAPNLVGGGVFRCCVPWCGARAAVPVDDADYALREGSPQLSQEEYVIPEPIVSSPRPLGQQSPLPGIEEEDDSDWPLEDATDATLTPSYRSTKSSTDTVFTSSRSSGKKRSFGSPSSVKICVSAAARKSSKARQRSAAGSGAAGQCEESQSQGAHSSLGSHGSHGRMQAEQGSIGELQKYHGRYLKSRRHTLANVR
ncbi:cAMP-specific 3',5'-cyclic phosphodiesterase, isoform I [Papilio machaon]|uniref:cAMP-specific 3',5'-cyclic phosphodiesterase, isoform I n=1 Tax=Papilio machaon TaxID=76193 RepID=A0A194R0K0_PAPMA|nr:cAMP-specific 3',5'-cyclic phosphodiesterase, isoform I [Papilio machaon]